MKFAFYTLGCKVNQCETQAMEHRLRQLGVKPAQIVPQRVHRGPFGAAGQQNHARRKASYKGALRVLSPALFALVFRPGAPDPLPAAFQCGILRAGVY